MSEDSGFSTRTSVLEDLNGRLSPTSVKGVISINQSRYDDVCYDANCNKENPRRQFKFDWDKNKFANERAVLNRIEPDGNSSIQCDLVPPGPNSGNHSFMTPFPRNTNSNKKYNSNDGDIILLDRRCDCEAQVTGAAKSQNNFWTGSNTNEQMIIQEKNVKTNESRLYRGKKCFFVICMTTQFVVTVAICAYLYYRIEQVNTATGISLAQHSQTTNYAVKIEPATEYERKFSQYAFTQDLVKRSENGLLQCNASYKYNKLSPCFACEKSKMVIYQTGNYFIYVNVLLQSINTINNPIEVSLIRIQSNSPSKNNEQTLTMAVLIPYEMQNHAKICSAYLGSITEMQRGDEIEIRLRGPLSIHADSIQPRSSFISVIKM